MNILQLNKPRKVIIIKNNIFKPKINKVFSFDESIKAYEYLMEYDVFGKIVVEIKN